MSSDKNINVADVVWPWRAKEEVSRPLVRKVFDSLLKIISVLLFFVLLVPCYYIFFTVGRIVFLALGKDPLNRKISKDEKSYWVVRDKIEDPKHFERQY